MAPLHRSSPSRRLRRGLLGCLLPVLLAAVLAGCSHSSGPAAAPSGNDSSSPSASSSPTGSAIQRYVALGDSYSAAPFVPVTDVAGGCFRSSANYPALVAQSLGARLEDRTCGGAETVNFLRPQDNGTVPPQSGALRPDTQLVTVGLGGNDENVFRTLVGNCVTRTGRSRHCQIVLDAPARQRLLGALGRTERRLVAVLRGVERRSPKAMVLAVGYPQIVSAAHRCALLPIAKADYAFAEQVNRALSESVRRAARQTGARYVDVWSASRGHDVCAKDPWINGPVNDQRRAAAYHPFAVEQQAVARLVLATVDR